MTGWETDPEVNIGWHTPVVFLHRANKSKPSKSRRWHQAKTSGVRGAVYQTAPPPEQGLLRPFCPVFREMTTWIKSADQLTCNRPELVRQRHGHSPAPAGYFSR